MPGINDVIWKDIPGYEGLYQASRCGKIKRLPITDRPVRNSSLTRERILISVNYGGYYLTVSLRKNNSNRNFPIHRLVAMTFIPNPENKPEINHKNLNKQNNHVDNLEWCTHQENIQHWANFETAVAESFNIGCQVLVTRLQFKATIVKKDRKWIQLDKVPEDIYDWFYYKELQLIA